MGNKKIHYDFNDILITPSETTEIRSRKTDINPYYIGDRLPIIVSPMDTVIDKNNWKKFLYEKMIICFPRGIKLSDFSSEDLNYMINFFKDDVFFSYSLDEILEIINKNQTIKNNVLIDIANGHMDILIDVVKKLKGGIIENGFKIMVGNIANPKTYEILSESGVDYIRVGIGFGGGCLTSMNTGVGYSMATLINKCFKIKKKLIKNNKNAAFIVGDGGFKNYSDIIKGLALGADYIMLGSILNKTVESSGDTYLILFEKFLNLKINLTKMGVSERIIKFLWKRKFNLVKKFRGMSTKEVQKKWGKTKLTTSEGVIRFRKIEYTLSGWRENFEDYLRSCMSYTNSKNLKDFIGKVKWTIISYNAYMRFNK